MDLSKILAVSGRPGLYKMLSQGKNSFIVESLTDGHRFPVFTHERVSSLEEISIFSTGDEDLPLKEIFRKISAKVEGGKAPEGNSNPDQLKGFFLEAVPEYDEERVYISDIRKVVNWYNLLLDKGLLIFDDEKEEKEAGEDQTAETKDEAPAGPAEKPEKKPARKKEK